MIRKLITPLMIAIVAVMAASCAGDQDKACKQIAESLEKQDFAKVEEICNSLYDRLPDCTVKTLGDMTMSYITLAAVNIAHSDEAGTVDAMRHAVGTYDEAMKKDPTQAEKLWKKMAEEENEQGLSLNPTDIINVFKNQLAAYDAAASGMDQLADSIAEAEIEATAVAED